MKATLGDILGGEVEIPAAVQRYRVKNGAKTIYIGGALSELDRLFDKASDWALWLTVWRNWPASVDWTVEWEQEKEQEK